MSNHKMADKQCFGKLIYNPIWSRFSLDITHLDEVEQTLVASRFLKSKWLRLGLRLGLYRNTLDDIEAKNRGDVDQCLLDCLTKWLQKCDNVKAPPSLAILANALRQIDQTASADVVIEISK